MRRASDMEQTVPTFCPWKRMGHAVDDEGGAPDVVDAPMFRLVARQRAGREDAGPNGPDVLSEGFFFRAVEEGFRRGGDEVHFALCVVHHDAFVDGVEDGSRSARCAGVRTGGRGRR